MKPNSIKPAHHRRQSAAGVFRLQRIYLSSAPGRTCLVSDSGGHQSASGGSAGPTLTRNHPPSALSPRFSPPNQQLTSPSRIPCPLSRHRYCSSYTYPSGNPRVYGILLIMRSEPKPNPNQTQTKPDPNPIQTQCKPNPNPIQTQSKPNPNPIQTRSKPNANPIQTRSKPNFSPLCTHEL